MATTTPNNGWTVPTSTDYVKDGATAIETLGDAIDASVGTGLLAWQTYAPTLGGGFANGNGVWNAKYCKIGKTVHVKGDFTFGTTTTKGNTLSISLPVAAVTTNQQPSLMHYSCAGTFGLSLGYIVTANTIVMRVVNVAGTYPALASITATVPGTWVTGDYITFGFTYEAA